MTQVINVLSIRREIEDLVREGYKIRDSSASKDLRRAEALTLSAVATKPLTSRTSYSSYSYLN